jgi:hypothetical protein
MVESPEMSGNMKLTPIHHVCTVLRAMYSLTL